VVQSPVLPHSRSPVRVTTCACAAAGGVTAVSLGPPSSAQPAAATTTSARITSTLSSWGCCACTVPDADVASAGDALYEALLTEATTPPVRIGTVDLPARVERERYFRELTYLELSALYAGPVKPSALAKWVEAAPKGTVGLVAPFVLTHRKPPTGPKLWAHDASSGDFRDSPAGRASLGPLRDAVTAIGATEVVFRSPEAFSPSAANRDQLRRFFGEVAPEEAIGAHRVWVPGGLWEARTAAKLATELGITLAIDPLVRAPGEPAEIHYDLEVTAMYLRVEGAGRTGLIANEKLEDIAALIEHYEDLPLTVAFASPERWQDARNLKKLLDG